MSDDVVAAAKRSLRREVRARLQARGPDALVTAGRLVSERLAPVLPQAGVVALYASRADELSTDALDDALQAAGLARAVPRIDGDDLTFHIVSPGLAIRDLPRDGHGIPTPAPQGATVALPDCALVVVPGLAFDRRGGRLGYGRGYYDRALRGVADRCLVGVLDECQWVDAVPCAAHDRRIPRLCSPAGVVAADG